MALEKIVIEIGGDAKDLNTTLNQLERIGIIDKKNAEQFKKSHNEHKQHLRETGDEIDRIDNKIRNLGERIVAAFAVERIVEFAKEAVLAFAEEEKMLKQLAFAVQKVNGEGNAAVLRLNESAEKLAKTLGLLYTPGQLTAAQKQLANFGLSSKQIDELLPKVVDLASATGMDLTSAVDKSILAINGQTKGLREVGISFKDTGDKTKNLAKLTEDLNKFTGASADVMETSAGRIQRATGYWEEFKQSIGQVIADKVVATGDAINDLYLHLKDLSGLSALAFDESKPLPGSRKWYEQQLKEAVAGDDKLRNEKIQQANKVLQDMAKTLQNQTAILTAQDELEHRKLRIKFNNQKKYFEDLIALTKESGEKQLGLTLSGEAKVDEENKKREEDFQKRMKAGDALRIQDEIDKNNELLKKDKEYWDKQLKLAVENSKQEADIRSRTLIILNDEEEAVFKKAKEGDKEAIQTLKDYASTATHLGIKAQEALDEIHKKVIQNIFETTKMFLDSLKEASELNVTGLESQQKRQQSIIETQKILAEKGLANDLAFEERRQNELEKKKQQEIKKQKHIKELGIFLNSMEKFSEDNPQTALAKALGVLAATKAAEVAFMEEGGLIGGSSQKSWKGRRHASGRDVLVHAEIGERMLSRKDNLAFEQIGGMSFIKSYLKTPLRERSIPMTPVFDNSGVITRLESLEQTIKNKPEYHVEWDGLDYRIEQMVKNGITERMKIHRPIL